MKKLKITINDQCYNVIVEEESESSLQAVEPQGAISRPATSRPSILPLPSKPASAGPVKDSSNTISSPMPGVVLSVKAKEGDTVNLGEVVFILEAMKMENEVTVRKGGVVKEVKVKEGQTVSGGEVLMIIE